MNNIYYFILDAPDVPTIEADKPSGIYKVGDSVTLSCSLPPAGQCQSSDR